MNHKEVIASLIALAAFGPIPVTLFYTLSNKNKVRYDQKFEAFVWDRITSTRAYNAATDEQKLQIFGTFQTHFGK